MNTACVPNQVTRNGNRWSPVKICDRQSLHITRFHCPLQFPRHPRLTGAASIAARMKEFLPDDTRQSASSAFGHPQPVSQPDPPADTLAVSRVEPITDTWQDLPAQPQAVDGGFVLRLS